MDIWVVLAYAAGLLGLYLLGYLLLVPLKTVGRLIGSALLGAVVLLLINFAGQSIGVYIAVNPLTALVTGFLGVPGVALLLGLQLIL